MNRKQAVEIQRHMLKAAAAINKANDIILELEKSERAVLAAALGEISSALHLEILWPVYARYPELKPDGAEPPMISSILEWDDVVLPEFVSLADLDASIFLALSSRWQKTAMVIIRTLQRCEELAFPIDADLIGARIGALAEADRLEGAGDLRKWRHSEVRLKP